MGAEDGGGGATNKPHPATTNPKPSCDDEAPPVLPRVDSGYVRHGLNVRDATRAQQVAEPAAYNVAGKILLATAGAVAGVLLALVAVYLYNSARRRRRSLGGIGGFGGRRQLNRSPAIAAAGDDDDAATPRGLDPAVLRALPVVVVAAGANSVGDCAVCLGELEPGEKARALPRCAHLFHADCIDAWFRGNATCPLCRADVVVVAPELGGRGAEASAPPELRVNVDGLGVHDHDGAAMGSLPSGTDIDKTRRPFFVSTRSISF